MKYKNLKGLSSAEIDKMIVEFINYKIEGYSNNFARSKANISEYAHFYLIANNKEYAKAAKLFKKKYIGVFSYLKADDNS